MPPAIREFLEKSGELARRVSEATGVPVRLVPDRTGFDLPPALRDICQRSQAMSDGAVKCLKFHRSAAETARKADALSPAACPNGLLNGLVYLPGGTRAIAALEIGPVPAGDPACESAFRLVEFLARQLCEEAEIVVRETDAEVPDPVRRVIRHMRENVSLTLGEAAKAASLSPDRFGRVFRRHTGKTFAAFLAKLRVERACAMLRNSPRARISDIAMDCGFESIPHFNRVFARNTGLSPSRYRMREAALAGTAEKRVCFCP